MNAASRRAGCKRRLGLAAAVGLVPLSGLISNSARAANTEYDVINGQTDLTAQATYTQNTTENGTGASSTPATAPPSSSSDVTFDSGVAYSPAAFTLNTSQPFGSLNDLSSTPITIDNTSASADTLTLAGGDGVSGSVSGDLLYVATGSSLNIGSSSSSGLGLALGKSGNFDVVGTGTGAIGSAISGTGFALTKTGTGSLTLAGANIYTGATNIAAGTLALSGGNDRLLNTGTLNFSGSSTLNLSGAISQTLGNITVADNVTGTVTGATATLSVTGAAMAIGSPTISDTQTLDLSGLGTFNYNNASGTFKVGGTFSGVGGSTGTVKLASVSTITASTVGVGTSGTNTSSSVDAGTLNLGPTATINANAITLGTGLANGTINYGVSTANPTLTLRGTTGGTSRTNLTIGTSAGTQSSTTGLIDLTTNVTGTSTLDAMIGTLTIGNYTRTTATSSNVPTTGTLLMGGGTLDATTIILGQNVNFTAANHTYTTTGTLTIGATAAGAGTVKVQTLSLGNQNSSNATNTVAGTFNLSGGANLYAQTIDKGTGTGTQAATRTFNWNAGTIHNYDANTDLTINSLASTGATTTFALLTSGAHTFNIDASRQATVNQIISGTGSGGLTNAGAGTLTLSAANSYTGPTAITGGILSTGATGILANNAVASSIGAGTFTAADLVLNGGTLQYANTTNTPESTNHLLTLAGNGTLDASGTSTITFAGNGSGAANAIAVTATAAPTFTFTGTNAGANTFTPIIGNAGVGTLTSVAKTGVGAWVLNGANTYSGGTTVNQGTLTSTVAGGFGTGFVTVNPTGTSGGATDAAVLNTTGSIGTGAAVTVNTNSMTAIGTINFNGATPVIGSLAGTGNVVLNNTSPGTALTTGSAGTTTFSGVISDNGGLGSLTKVGSTAFTLTGANTYGGGTTLSAGTLYVSNTNTSASGTGSGSVAVNGGTLGGVGSITGTITFATSGTPTLQPGAAASHGILTATNALSLSSTSAYVAQINGAATSPTVGTDYSQLSGGTTGTVNLNSALVSVMVLDGTKPTVNTTYQIINYTGDAPANAGPGPVSGTFSNMVATDQYGDTYSVQYDDGTNGTGGYNSFVDLTVTSTPEPGSLSLLALGGLGLMRRRRKQSAGTPATA